MTARILYWWKIQNFKHAMRWHRNIKRKKTKENEMILIVYNDNNIM